MQDHEQGHAVFFDYLGLFFVSYSKETGTIINYSVAASVLVLILISVTRISELSSVSFGSVMLRLISLWIIQIIALALGVALPLCIAYYLDSVELSLTYYSSKWLIIGLYVCPTLIGLSVPTLLYLQCQQQVSYNVPDNPFSLPIPLFQSKLSFSYNIQLGLHSWALVLVLLIIALVSLGIRSVYIFTFPLAFYTLALIVNLLTTCHDRRYSWAGSVATLQIIPFLYSCYVIFIFIVLMTPSQGRSGSASNPDIMISGLAILGSILSFGFLVRDSNSPAVP